MWQEDNTAVADDAPFDAPARPKAIRKRDPREWDAARAYLVVLVPDHASSGQYTHWDVDRWRPCYSPSWYTRRYPITIPELHAALFRGDKLDVRGVERVGYVVVDVDAHKAAADGERSPSTVVHLDDWIRARSGAAIAARRRRAVRDAAWPVVEALLECVPGAVPVMTARGYHVVVLLAEAAPVAEAAGMAAELSRGLELPDGVHVEAWPKLDGDGTGRICALPLCGRSRIVRSDGLRRAHRTRIEDVSWLLVHAPRISLDDLAGTRVPGHAVVPSGSPQVPIAQAQVARASSDDAPMRQTYGRDFAEQCEERVLGRVRDDESLHATWKLAALCVYLAIPCEVAERAFDAWLEQPQHEADHFQSEHGRKALRRSWRSFRRRYARGVRAGSVRPGEMRSPSLRRLIHELAAAAPEIARAA